MSRVLPRSLSLCLAAALAASPATSALAQSAPPATPAPLPPPTSASASTPAPPPESAPAAVPDAASLPPPEPTPSPEPTPTPAYVSSTPESRSHRTARTLGWISLAIGAEAAVVAVATSFMALHDKNERDANCDANKVCNATGVNDNSALDSLLGWNAAAYAVAAVGIGAGLVLLLSNPSDGAKQTAVVVSPNGAGAGVSLRSAF